MIILRKQLLNYEQKKGDKNMETVRLNLESIIPKKPHIVEPNFDYNPSDQSLTADSVSKWRYLDDELGYYLENTRYIEGTTCYDEILL